MRSGKRVGGYIDYFLQNESRIIHSHRSQTRVMVSRLSLLTVLIVAQPPTTTPYKPPPLLTSPFMPTAPSIPPGVLLSAVIFPQTLGVYIIEIEVGTPPVSHLMLINTGSDVTWFQCKPCNCYLTHTRHI
jgi:hypothetical protein